MLEAVVPHKRGGLITLEIGQDLLRVLLVRNKYVQVSKDRRHVFVPDGPSGLEDWGLLGAVNRWTGSLIKRTRTSGSKILNAARIRNFRYMKAGWVGGWGVDSDTSRRERSPTSSGATSTGGGAGAGAATSTTLAPALPPPFAAGFLLAIRDEHGFHNDLRLNSNGLRDVLADNPALGPDKNNQNKESWLKLDHRVISISNCVRREGLSCREVPDRTARRGE